MYEFDHARLLALTGACYGRLGKTAAAERTLREALQALGPKRTRRRAEVLVDLARVRARQQNAEEAAGLAGEALEIAVETGSPLPGSSASSASVPTSPAGTAPERSWRWTNSSPMSSDDRREVIPYGWWPSSIGADLVAARSISYDAVHTIGDTVAWLETRTADGCTVVATWTAGQGTKDATPDGFDVSTSIHAYGGGAYTYTPAGLVVVNAEDQRLHLIDPDRAARPITPPSDDRYGDLRPLNATTLVCVRERPGGPDELVVLPLDGSAPPRPVHEGHDFYAFPRTSRDRRQLAWITWDNPNLPWDGSDLWVADLLGGGLNARLGPARHVAGGPDESVTQPEWGPDGALHFISDRSGWWNLYRERNQQVEPLLPIQAEFADAPWELDYST